MTFYLTLLAPRVDHLGVQQETGATVGDDPVEGELDRLGIDGEKLVAAGARDPLGAPAELVQVGQHPIGNAGHDLLPRLALGVEAAVAQHRGDCGRAAEHAIAFDEQGAGAAVCCSCRRRDASRPAADHDDVVVLATLRRPATSILRAHRSVTHCHFCCAKEASMNVSGAKSLS